MKLYLVLKFVFLLYFSSILCGKFALTVFMIRVNVFCVKTGQLVYSLTQEEWLDRYDLIEDDWFTSPRVSDDGSGFEDGDLNDGDIRSEL